MRLSELSDDEHRYLIGNTMLPHQVITWLQDKGLQKIGEGAFSAVYARTADANKVVKINTRPDEAFKDYIDFVQKNSCVYFPHIYDVKELKNDIYMYIIEHLNRFPPAEQFWEDNLQKYYGFLCVLGSTFGGDMALDRIDAKRPMRNYEIKEYGKVLQQTRESNTEFTKRFRQEHLDAFLKTREGKLVNHVLRDMGYKVDLHRGNIMIRKSDGHIVLSDPIVGKF